MQFLNRWFLRTRLIHAVRVHVVRRVAAVGRLLLVVSRLVQSLVGQVLPDTLETAAVSAVVLVLDRGDLGTAHGVLDLGVLVRVAGLLILQGISRILIVEIVLVVAAGWLEGVRHVVALMIGVQVLLELLHARVALVAADGPFRTDLCVILHAVFNLY